MIIENTVITLYEKNEEFKYDNAKQGKNSENNYNEDNEYNKLILDFSILKEKKNEQAFLSFISENMNNYKMIEIENKNVLNKKIIKSSLIRYYLISKIKNVVKVDIIKNETNKDILNNFYLPDTIFNYVEEKGFCNLLNTHRIKIEFNFLTQRSIGLNVQTINAEKYFNENFE